MKKLKNLKLWLKELPKNRWLMLFIIFVATSLIAVFAADVVVKQGDLIVDTNVLYINSTSNRVGIGTSSPTMPLSFGGTVGGIAMSSSDGGDNGILQIGGGGNVGTNRGGYINLIGNEYASLPGAIQFFSGTGSGSGSDIEFYTDQGGGSVVKLIIKKSGEVGIGTLNPTHKLNVVGNVNVTGTIYYGSLVAQSPHMFEPDDHVGYTRSCWYDSAGYWDLVWYEEGVMKVEKNSVDCTNKYDRIVQVRTARNNCEAQGLVLSEEDLSCV